MRKGSQIVISKQDLLKCEGTRHSYLEGSSCVQGNESSLGDIHTDMKMRKVTFFGRVEVKHLQSHLKTKQSCVSVGFNVHPTK